MIVGKWLRVIFAIIVSSGASLESSEELCVTVCMYVCNSVCINQRDIDVLKINLLYIQIPQFLINFSSSHLLSQ